ncbi:MAG: EAL domain-containing protein [Pseudomonadota bacterium]
MPMRNLAQDSTAHLIAQFDAVFGGASVCAALLVRNRKVLYANQSFVRATDWQANNPKLADLEAIFQDFDYRAFDEACSNAEGKTSVERVLFCKTANASASKRLLQLYVVAWPPSGDAVGTMVLLGVDAEPASSLPDLPVGADRPPDMSDCRIRASTRASRISSWRICPDTGETWFSDLWYEHLGYDPSDVVSSPEAFFELIHPDDRTPTLKAYDDLLQGRSAYFQSDYRLRAADGTWCWISGAGAKLVATEATSRDWVYGTQTDITWRKAYDKDVAAEAKAAVEHRNRLDQLAENSPVGLFEFKKSPDGSIEFPYISQSVIETLGVSREEVDADGSSCFRHILPEYLEPLNEAIGLSQANLTPFRFKYRLAHPKRGIVWVQANSVPTRLEDRSTTWHGSLYDITPEVEREAALQEARDEALQMQKQMEELALHDVLTGLPNRRYFDMRLHQQRERALQGKGDGTITLIRVDLDHFKYVNDNLGHDAGDAVLVHVAQVLRDSIRNGDFVARLGGDEFSIILRTGGGTKVAQTIIRRMQQALREPFLYGEQVCRFGASFGIATCESRKAEASELHAFADAALYEAKSKGRNRVELFTDELHAHIMDNRRLTSEIEHAIERGEFEPVFQPQFCARNRVLYGLETLARWRHPERGLLGPDIFLDVAEQIRVVPLIDQIMMEKTCGILARWRDADFIPPKISFNVSSGRLRDPEVLNAARRILKEGTKVAFELMESTLVAQTNDEFRFTLDALKDSGILIEIDDFGSGHASIIGVMEVAPSMLKIDKRLSRNVVDFPQARELIAAIVRISAALGISTTVEGVETQPQASILTDLGCDVLQGFHYAKPLNETEMLEFIRVQKIHSA